ncbi:penicillin-binding protein [Deinococcus yavapaiensis]|uniref:Thioredoxin n=1 Tax=Deinococcus yavapaiensis KR-236 TaxID=694435 RepID=A0A318S9R2_9DEIO|nr:penicillin-binding protein [Deinococcus yavapaiensis]PYE55880.1 hypothetical protein DES52_102246 [Deinococcus yavapaiensis KR-236]
MRTIWFAALTLLSAAEAVPKLGEALPRHPWSAAALELVVVYSHDCGDLGALWKDVLASQLPIRVVNAEAIPASAPNGLDVWRGEDATAFSRALKVRVYPTILLVREGRLLNVWEGTFDLGALKALL